MPIAFSSISHGKIPIGFFNIETDMMLMDHYFFFSTDFCEWVIEWIDAQEISRDERRVYVIPEARMIGDLAGAIYGFEYTGFIGEVYKLFPFPESRSGFKQKPYGTQNREAVEKAIQPLAESRKIPIVFSRDVHTVGFGDYVFSGAVFNDILRYIEAGGMPRWLDERPPDYVVRMTARLMETRPWWIGSEAKPPEGTT